jgi:hypothetical protein
MTSCSPLSCIRRFGRSYRLHLQGRRMSRARNQRESRCLLDGLLNYSSTLKMEAIRSSETLGATQWTTRRHIPEDDTLHNHRCENLKSYKLIQSASSHLNYLTSILILFFRLCLDLTSDRFFFRFPIKTFYALPPCVLHATPNILVDLINVIIFDDDYRNAHKSSLCNYFQALVTSPVLSRPNLLLSPLVSDTIGLCYSVNA